MLEEKVTLLQLTASQNMEKDYINIAKNNTKIKYTQKQYKQVTINTLFTLLLFSLK